MIDTSRDHRKARSRGNSQRNLLCHLIGLALLGIGEGSAFGADATSVPTAMQGEQGDALDEIIVTARKREETLLTVPVAISVVSEKMIDDYAVNDVVSAGKLTPGLLLSRATTNGAVKVSLRGVGSSSTSPSFDQAVSLNVDNVPISKGRAIYQSFFDMEQMEVLRGPQALFFGKNSTAGVISVRTASPTDTTEFLVRGGTEVESNQYFGELVGSGPLSNTVGMRVALRASTMDGFFKNIGTSLNGVPRSSHAGEEDEYGGRITLVYRPSDAFDLNAKMSYDQLKNDGVNGFTQLVNCQGPGGTPQPIFGVPTQGDGCRLDKTTSEVALDPAIAAHFPNSHGGRPYNKYTGYLGSITAQYRWDSFNITSVTGYYKYDNGPQFGNFDLGSASQVFGNERSSYKSLSQELRLSSALQGLLNFNLGFFFDDTKLNFARAVRLFSFAPPDPVTGRTDNWDSGGTTKGNTYSAFAELVFQMTPTLDLSGGARYSHEKKNSSLRTFYASQSAIPFGLVFEPGPINDRFKDDNLSPQVTLRWRPTDWLTMFATYKEGYKSGGSNIGEIPFIGTTANVLSFESEQAKGWEVGMKGEALDGRLSYDVLVFDYKFSNLQVSQFDPLTVTLHVDNAGKYRTRGVELQGAYSVQAVHGLGVRGSVYYNDAEYTNYIGPCYTGQTIAQGCNLLQNAFTGAFTSQNYKGFAGTHAPKWAVSAGTDYEFPITDGGMKVGLSVDARYTSSFYVGETLSPFQKQKSYVDLNAALRVFREDGRWEFAVIGRNLTDKLVGSDAYDLVGTGFGTGTNNGLPADTQLTVGAPRQIVLRGTYRW